MKKGIALCLLVFAALLLTGCSGSKTLTILVDLQDEMKSISEQNVLAATNALAREIEKHGGPTDLEFISLPAKGSEREIMIERLRTEIMSGEGPDVMLINSRLYSEALFPIIEKEMEQKLFLPLDPYIERAQFMEWDKLTPVVMEAGRTGEGQQLLPMAYTFPVTYYDDTAVEDTPSAARTWADMLADDTDILRNAGASIYSLDGVLWGSPFGGFLGAFGEFADYENETLLFTEEALQQRLEEAGALHQQAEAGEFSDLPMHHKGSMSVEYNGLWGSIVTGSLLQSAEVEFVPQYSADGGVTAVVTSFLGINRNTERPEDAFFVADYLMSCEAQQNLRLYEMLLTLSSAVPMHEDLMQSSYPVCGWSMSENNYAEFCAARDAITQARFAGGLEQNLRELFSLWSEAEAEGKSSEDIKRLVEEAYGTMELRLKE